MYVIFTQRQICGTKIGLYANKLYNRSRNHEFLSKSKSQLTVIYEGKQ